MTRTLSWPLEPANPQTFRGSAFMRLVAAATTSEEIKLYYVHFEPGARTNWHAHSGEQILVVTAGRCRYQIEGEPVAELAEGESVRFLPGQRHWHGATPTTPADHVAVNLRTRETTWLEPVEDREYDPGS